MKHYRIYFLDLDGKIDGRPAEMEASSDDEVVMRAIMAERNAYGAEVWCGATLVRRVNQASAQPAYTQVEDRGAKAGSKR